MLLLGELAGYWSEWHAPLATVARDFAAMTSRAADDLDAVAAAAADQPDGDAVISSVRQRQCRLRCTALLCYAAGPSCELPPEEAASFARLLVQAKHAHIYVADEGHRQELASLLVRARNAAARRSAALLAAAQKWPADVLSGAVLSVLRDRAAAARLGGWRRVGSAASFHATDAADGALISVNLLDGTLLVDGWPPGRLPMEVTGHALYQRVFGPDTNFEVRLAGRSLACFSEPFEHF